MKTNPTRPPRHLHVFGISLLLIVGALVFFLFGVKMEATVAGTGIVSTQKTIVLRAPKAGRVKIGGPGGESVGSTNFQAFVPGLFIDAGTNVIWCGDSTPNDAVLRAPGEPARWLILELPVADGQFVQEGDVLASLIPVDPDTHRPLDLVVRVEIDEKQFASVEAGQETRLYSNMHHHRTHGIATGVVERIEPLGTDGPNGSRKFHAWIKVTNAPFPLKLGSSVRAEIVTGQKPTFQIILEH
jgi:hypothetical protein